MSLVFAGIIVSDDTMVTDIFSAAVQVSLPTLTSCFAILALSSFSSVIKSLSSASV